MYLVDLFQGVREAVEVAHTCLRIVVGKFKCGKGGGHQKKKLYRSSSVETPNKFKEEHQGP